MFAARKHSFKTLSSLILDNPFKIVLLSRDVPWKFTSSNVIHPSFPAKDVSLSSIKPLNCFHGSRAMSTVGKGRSMRSKVESRMRKESGKTLREIRRAQKLKKKLMTEEERLIYNLRRAKKKVALLLQKLKKYELPELPPSRHDPELFTSEQIQAYKKIGFKNRNYVPVGVRGVFGGVVQNMHLHWKFHETVQVCCDNFPKEKIKEMAIMLARLSGGIVINIHNVKTIIMFRGRNYRQPKNLIPINTLTKRKALFKARFEQALESQKLNIKKIEQELRRKGVNPDDPVAMASIQRVASTFFNAVDKREGSPYVFREDKLWEAKPSINQQQSEYDEDSEQEELDRFIAEIEDAADKEWAAEEAAEKEEVTKIRYFNRVDDGRFRRSEMLRTEDFDDNDRGRARSWKDAQSDRQRTDDSDDDADYTYKDDEEWGSNDVGDASDNKGDFDDHNRARNEFKVPRVERGKQSGIRRSNSNEGFKKDVEAKFRGRLPEKFSGSENTIVHVEDAMWQSDSEEEEDLGRSKVTTHGYKSSSDEVENYLPAERGEKDDLDEWNHLESDDDGSNGGLQKIDLSTEIRGWENKIGRANNHQACNRNSGANFGGKITEEKYDSSDLSSYSEIATWESDAEEELDSESVMKRDGKDRANNRKMKTPKQGDETWDSD